MEVNKEQHEDMPNYDMDYEQDDGTQVYDWDTEDGEKKNINYNSHSDSDEQLQNTVPTRLNRKRGMIRLPKLKTEYVNSGGRKKCVKFDEFSKFTRNNNAVFLVI
ncbi:unnamed protein product [Lactuca saligna]|uniref:Uncharacterized protein n=1 Tax=Lactuca saligna TaxID=75948 RepID=A0AA36E708_LACSI|nr:unnamed protein product [Lactuca saligna]